MISHHLQKSRLALCEKRFRSLHVLFYNLESSLSASSFLDLVTSFCILLLFSGFTRSILVPNLICCI
jgi:hypothetical protein